EAPILRVDVVARELLHAERNGHDDRHEREADEKRLRPRQRREFRDRHYERFVSQSPASITEVMMVFIQSSSQAPLPRASVCDVVPLTPSPPFPPAARCARRCRAATAA